MDTATTFYVLGGVLAAAAVTVSFVGLRVASFPGRAAPVVFLVFAVLIGGATTFAVRNGQEEQEARASELEKAGEEAEEEEESPVPAEEGQKGGQEQKEAGEGRAKEVPIIGKEGPGPGGTLQLAADPTQIAFDTTSLSSKPGKVTIAFDNPSAIEHDVAIEKDGEELAKSALVTEGKTSVSVDLEPGDYTFLCTVPGHAEAGMEGTLTVK
jgi:plastocyanin